MTQRLTGPALIEYLRDNPTSDAMRSAADEIERLRTALEHCVMWLPEDCSAAYEARAVLGEGHD